MPLDLNTTKPWRRVQFRTEDNLQGLTVTGGIGAFASEPTDLTLPYGSVLERLLSNNLDEFDLQLRDNFKRRYLEGDEAFSPLFHLTDYFGTGRYQPAGYRRIMDDPRSRIMTQEELAQNLGAFKDTELLLRFRKRIVAPADIWFAAEITTGWTNLKYVEMQRQLGDPAYWEAFHLAKARWSASRDISIAPAAIPGTQSERINVLGDTMITGIHWTSGANLMVDLSTSFLRKNTGLSNNPIRIDFLGGINTGVGEPPDRVQLWDGVMFCQMGDTIVLNLQSLSPGLLVTGTITIMGYQANSVDMDPRYQMYYLEPRGW